MKSVHDSLIAAALANYKPNQNASVIYDKATYMLETANGVSHIYVTSVITVEYTE